MRQNHLDWAIALWQLPTSKYGMASKMNPPPDKFLAHQFLDELWIPYQSLTFSPTIEKGASNVADALGFKNSQMVKTLIFESSEDEQVLVMLAADKNAISGYLKRAIGSRNIRLAQPERVKQLTGYEIGSIPPFHWQPTGFRTFIDASLMEEEVLGVGAGVWGEEIMIAPADLVKASKATIVNLSERLGGADT